MGKGEWKTGKSLRKPVQRAESIFPGHEHISFNSSHAPPVPTDYPIHKIYFYIGQFTTNSIKTNTVNDLPIVVECSSSTEIVTAVAVFIVCRWLLRFLSPDFVKRRGVLEWLDFGETPVWALRRRFARRRRPNGHHRTVCNDQLITMIYRDQREIKTGRRAKTTTTIMILTRFNRAAKR